MLEEIWQKTFRAVCEAFYNFTHFLYCRDTRMQVLNESSLKLKQLFGIKII